MSAPNAGPTPVAVAVDGRASVRNSLPGGPSGVQHRGKSLPDVGAPDEAEDRPVAPDQFDPKYETTKWEIWAYYRYVER